MKFPCKLADLRIRHPMEKPHAKISDETETRVSNILTYNFEEINKGNSFPDDSKSKDHKTFNQYLIRRRRTGKLSQQNILKQGNKLPRKKIKEKSRATLNKKKNQDNKLKISQLKAFNIK